MLSFNTGGYGGAKTRGTMGIVRRTTDPKISRGGSATAPVEGPRGDRSAQSIFDNYEAEA